MVQQSFEEWEDRTKQEMEQCCRYLDKLSVEDRVRYDRDWVRSRMQTPAFERPWNQVRTMFIYKYYMYIQPWSCNYILKLCS